MKKTLFGMAALLLTLASCGKMETDITPVDHADDITITATLAPKEANTKAVSTGTNKITVRWAKNEKMAVLYMVNNQKKVATATITAVDGATGEATISFSVVSSTPNNTPCTLVYPASAAKSDKSGVKKYADMLATQDGKIKANFDVRVGKGTIQTTTPGLSISTQPAAQYSIFKFTLTDVTGKVNKTASEFKVSDASGHVVTTVTPSASTFYVALPVLSAGTYWFNATSDSNPYIAKATVSTPTEAGKYYQTNVKMATYGDLMGADGRFYADASGISAAKTSVIGVLAHIGTDPTSEAIADGGGHGLVLCVTNAEHNSDASWHYEGDLACEFGEDAFVTGVDDLKRTTNVSGYANTNILVNKKGASYTYKAAYTCKNYKERPAPEGTTGWFLPSAQQWVKIIEGICGLEDGAPSWKTWFDTSRSGLNKWENILEKAGWGNYSPVDQLNIYHMTSSEYSVRSCIVLRSNHAGPDNYGLRWDLDSKKTVRNELRATPALAF